MKDLNATQAAIRAGYSEKTAYSVGHENLRKPEILECLEVEMAERERRTLIDADWVLKEAARCYQINAKEKELDTGETVLVNANAAKGFLELCGKHVNVKAFEDSVNIQATVKKSLDDLY